MTKRGLAGRVLIAIGLVALALTTQPSGTAMANTQTISISPTHGSATQRITVDFVGDFCGPGSPTFETFWDGVWYGLDTMNPPTCEVTFTMKPVVGHRNPGKHKLCVGGDVLSCATFTILGPNPTPRPTPKPTPRPTPRPTVKPNATPTPPASDSPSPTGTLQSSEPALALAPASPTAAPSGGNAGPAVVLTGVSGAIDPTELIVIGASLVAVTGAALFVARRRRRRFCQR